MFTFPTPNFRCQVSEQSEPDKKLSRLVHAPDEAAARRLLEAREYTIHRIRPYDFATWIRAAQRYTRLAAKARSAASPARRKKFDFKPLWSVLKEVLLDSFHGKCAYCDSLFAHVAYGDVDHFRPKGEVAGDPTHPGYYWLAYDPTNYLPSCEQCNRGDAKKDKFPISGKRARGPSDRLDLEKPDLLAPHELKDYVTYEPSTNTVRPGWAKPRKPCKRAEASIQIYRLNRQSLAQFRLNALRQARIEYSQAVANWVVNNIDDAMKRVEDECRTGNRQFAAATIAEIEDFLASKRMRSPF